MEPFASSSRCVLAAVLLVAAPATGQRFDAYHAHAPAPRRFGPEQPSVPVRRPRVDWEDDARWQPLPERSTTAYRAGDTGPSSVSIGRTRSGRLFPASPEPMVPHPGYETIDDRVLAHRVFHHSLGSFPEPSGGGRARNETATGTGLDWTDGVEPGPLTAPALAPQAQPVPAWIRERRASAGWQDWTLDGDDWARAPPDAPSPRPTLRPTLHPPVWRRRAPEAPIPAASAVTPANASAATAAVEPALEMGAGKVAPTNLRWSEAREFGVHEAVQPRDNAIRRGALPSLSSLNTTAIALINGSGALSVPHATLSSPPVASRTSTRRLEEGPPCVPGIKGEWGELPRCARTPPAPPPAHAPPPTPAARGLWFDGEHAVASLAYRTRVASISMPVRGGQSPVPGSPALPPVEPSHVMVRTAADDGLPLAASAKAARGVAPPAAQWNASSGEEREWGSPPVTAVEEAPIPVAPAPVFLRAREGDEVAQAQAAARVVAMRDLAARAPPVTGLQPNEVGTSYAVSLAPEATAAVPLLSTGSAASSGSASRR